MDNGIKCWSCKDRHATIADVKACHGNRFKPETKPSIQTITPDFNNASIVVTPIKQDEISAMESAAMTFLNGGNMEIIDVVAKEPTVEMATERQVLFILDLLEKREGPTGMSKADIESLTKSEAHNQINVLLAAPKKDRAAINGIPSNVPDSRYAVIGEDGNARFYRVATNRDGKTRKIQKVLGSPGDFRYVPITVAEAQNALREIAKDPGMAATMFGYMVGACGICGSPLTDPESIRLGIGPICLKKYDW